MKTAHIFVSGFVQGVGFRHFVRQKALEFGLTGWVRNTPASPSAHQGGPEGRVEALFAGEKEKIEKVIEACRKGPFLSEVESVEVRWEEAKEKFEIFDIAV